MPAATDYPRRLARTALAGGMLSALTSLAMLGWQLGREGRNVDAAVFFVVWSAVGLATAFTAGVDFWRQSPALRMMSPSLLTGAALSACLTLTTGLPLLPVIFWLVMYGLALLSTVPFAPSSVVALGWAFLCSGIGAFFYLMYESIMPEFELPTPTRFYPAAVMGLTFGVYHLVWAAWAWPRRKP